MLSLHDRIDLLEADLKADPPAFIMSRQLPFAIFRYDPHSPEESEWRLRAEMQKLATRLENETGGRVGLISLATCSGIQFENQKVLTGWLTWSASTGSMRPRDK